MLIFTGFASAALVVEALSDYVDGSRHIRIEQRGHLDL